MCYAIDKKDGSVHEFDTRELREKILSLFGGTWILLDKKPSKDEATKLLDNP